MTWWWQFMRNEGIISVVVFYPEEGELNCTTIHDSISLVTTHFCLMEALGEMFFWLLWKYSVQSGGPANILTDKLTLSFISIIIDPYHTSQKRKWKSVPVTASVYFLNLITIRLLNILWICNLIYFIIFTSKGLNWWIKAVNHKFITGWQ